MNLYERSYFDKKYIDCDVGALTVNDNPISFYDEDFNYKDFYTTDSLGLYPHYELYPESFTLKEFIEFEIMGAKTAIQILKDNQDHINNMKNSLKKLKKIKALSDDNLYDGLLVYLLTTGLYSREELQIKANEFRSIQQEYISFQIESIEENLERYKKNKIVNTIKNICLQNLINELKKHKVSLGKIEKPEIIAKHILRINSLSPTDEYISLKELKEKIEIQNINFQTKYILNF